MRMILPLTLALLIPLLRASEVPVVPAVAVSPTGDTSGDTAVIIGISDYAALPDVPYADRDAAAFQALLTDVRRIPAARVHAVARADRASILAAVTAAGQQTGAGGVVWIYFAGHGAAAPDDGSRLFIAADAPADPAAFYQHTVKVNELTRLATAWGAQVMLVAETGYTGADRSGQPLVAPAAPAVPAPAAPAAPATAPALTTAAPALTTAAPAPAQLYAPGVPRVQEWTAAAAGQTPGALPGVAHGAFTWFTVAALRGAADGAVDGQLDGAISIQELQRWVNWKLYATGLDQTPALIGGPASFPLTSGLPLDVRGVAPPVTAESPAAVTAGPPTAAEVKPEIARGHLGGGVEFGALNGFRVEAHMREDSAISAFGIRASAGLGLAYFYSPGPAGGVMLYVDGRANSRSMFQTEVSVGYGTIYSGGQLLVGAAAQYDPPEPFQMNLGVIVGFGSGFGIIPDVSAAFVW